MLGRLNFDRTATFWKPIEFRHLQSQLIDQTPQKFMAQKSFACKIFEAAEAYFSPTTTKFLIVTILTTNLTTNRGITYFEEKPSSCAQTALKVASYFTLILPVVALIIKCAMRYTKFGALRPNFDQLYQAQMFNLIERKCSSSETK